jgi:hypothetical protein
VIGRERANGGPGCAGSVLAVKVQHELPLPPGGLVERRSDACDKDPTVTMVVSDDPNVVEAALAAGQLACGCGARLAPWGYGRSRWREAPAVSRDDCDRDELAARRAGQRRCCWPTGACPDGGTRSRSSAPRCWPTHTVSDKRRAVTRRSAPQLTDALIAAAAKRYQQGQSLTDIATASNASSETIRRPSRSRHITLRPRGRQGAGTRQSPSEDS